MVNSLTLENNFGRQLGIKSFTFPEWVFYAFFIFAYLNIGDLFTRLFRQPIPINIIIFGFVFILIVIKAKYKFAPGYFGWVYVFFVLFVCGGFMGLSTKFDYEVIQSIGKHWIAQIGIPWLGLTCIRKETYRVYLKSLLIMGGLAGIFSIFQVPFFFFFEPIISAEPIRTAAFWINPNNAAMMLILTFFVTISFPTKKKNLLLLTRILIIIGILTTFSRTGILIFVGGVLFYAFYRRKVKLIIAAISFFFLAVLALIAMFDQFTEAQQTRLTSVVDLASNKEMKADNRSVVWTIGFLAVAENSPVWGLGHTSMDRIVPIGNGLGPHNYFIWIWGNSGLIGLFGVFLLVYGLFRSSIKIRDPDLRVGLLIISGTFFLYLVFAHAIMSHQSTGIFMTLIVVSYANFSKKNVSKIENDLES